MKLCAIEPKELEEKLLTRFADNQNDELLEDLSDYVINSQKEIKKLNRLISQREQKWEKWSTEKQILSSKMSDYLCKYQNIKREYTKQIKISTDRKKEIERLNNIINKIDTYANKMRYYADEDDKEYIISKDIHNILQELKGSKSYEQQ